MAQDVSKRPARAGAAVEALAQADWRMLEPGLRHLDATMALGTRLTALRVDTARFGFQVFHQKADVGERAAGFAKRGNAVAVVNGGFFSEDDGKLKPVGLLMDDGKKLSRPWMIKGGFLAVDATGRARIIPSRRGLPAGWREIIQSRPVLIEPGGRWAMRTNDLAQSRRTLICILPGSDVVLLIVSGRGLSLYEAGWLFRSPDWGGFFDCDAAIALDGGGSTQLTVPGNGDLTIEGETPVNNALAVIRKR